MSTTQGVNGTSRINGTHLANGVNGVNGHGHTHAAGVNGSSPAHNGTATDAKPTDTAEPDHKTTPIAVCGIGLRLPGGSSTPQEFWDFLVNKGDARTQVPKSRYNVSAYHATSKRPTTIASEYGYFLDESVKLGAMDTSRFSMGRVELEYADPQQRRLLEVVAEALEDAGEVNFRGKKIGCFLGNMNEDWGEMMNRDPLWHGPNKIDGYQDWIIPNRISYEFGLRGPSMIIRTACSSALVGVNEACAAMQRGLCESAVVAGANLMLAPGMTQQMTEKGILSPEGSCKSFSADADGYARGEAFTAVLLKPLDAAIRDGNSIRAVIRAAVANSDGKTQGITQPNALAHEEMIRLAYKQAGISDFSKTAYFECHGTGTPVGDPIETGAVANVFGDDGIYITSVKPNVGHTEGASGLVSLIKAVLSLEHRLIPPNIKFNIPNPKIPFSERKLTVPLEPTPFPEDRLERVSVNSFGLGGSNAHVIVESARSFNLPEPAAVVEESIYEPRLLLFSAASSPSLKSMTQIYEDWITNHPDMEVRAHDLAYTLANRREHFSHRSFKISGTGDVPASKGRKIPNQPVNLVMVFTGQGAQWPRMGRELLQRDDLVFQTTIRTLDQYLQETSNAPEWTIETELNKSAKTSNLHKAELSQPICTAVQVGLVDLLAAVGVSPAAVVGHSSGELAAAYAAGALTAKEAIIGAYQRGQAAKLQSRKGAMAAVGLSRDEVEPYLNQPLVVIACENSPQSVTLSGDEAEVRSTVERIKEAHPDITARLLKVEKAYHSYHMREIGRDYHGMIQGHLAGRPAVKPFFSSVSGSGKPEEGVLDAAYWQQNLESPVLFSQAMAGVLEHMKNPAFVEVGPHGALAGPARQIFAKASASPPYLSVMTRNENCVQSYLSAVGKLFELNVSLNYAAIAPPGKTLPDLPRYPWNYEGEFWAESRMSAEWRHPRFPRHPLLGRRQLESTSLEPSWRNMVSIEDAPWLRDHVIQNAVIFPAAGYLAMAGEAVRQTTGIEESYSIRHMVLSRALMLQEGVESEIVTNLRPGDPSGQEGGDQWWEFSIASYSGNSWVKHCSGQVSAVAHAKPVQPEPTEPLPRKLDSFKVFGTLAKAGMQYGPSFQRLEQISSGTLERKAVSQLAGAVNGDEDKYHLHPTIIDAALQMGLIACRRGRLDANNCAAMPTLIEDVTILKADLSASLTASASTEVHPGNGDIGGQFQVIADGKVVLDMPKASFTPLKREDQGTANRLPITGRVAWSPHIDFIPTETLIKPGLDGAKVMPLLNELGELCYVFFQRRIDELTNLSEKPAVEKLIRWVNGQFQALPKDHPVHSWDLDTIVNRAHKIGELLADTQLSACADSLLEVGGSIDELLTGQIELVDLLQKDALLTRLFASANTFDHSPFIRSLAHAIPSLRVLEIGAGPGQVTESVMKDLVLPHGALLYSKYTIAAASPSSLAAVKKQFQHLDNMEYRALDIGKDLGEQGFGDADQYDLVIATNIIHATDSLSGALSNVRKLLAPGGRLLLQELNTQAKWINCILGFLDDWWVGENDGRPDEPYVGPDRWEAELAAAGFGASNFVLDSAAPHQLCAVTIARPVEDAPDPGTNSVAILAHEVDVKNVSLVTKALESRGYAVSARRLDDESPETSPNVIALLDERDPFFENIEQGRFKHLQRYIANIGNSGLFWITRMAQMQAQDPRYAAIIGASRSIRHENAMDFATCEVESLSASLDAVLDTFVHFSKRREDEFFRPNYEYAIVDGTVNVPRVYPFTFEDERNSNRPAEERLSLAVRKRGNNAGHIGSLQWESHRAKPLVGNQVEVEVYASSLSPRDVSAVLGTAPNPNEGLGSSACGRVTAVGPEVKNLQLGTRVICLASGTISSHLVTCEDFVEQVPDNLTSVEATALAAPYVTALAGLREGGILESGQTLLIVNAASSIGLAAVQLAQKSMTDIYATVGSDEEAEVLVRNLNLGRDRIVVASRESLPRHIMKLTDGRGIDLALNALSGEPLDAIWNSLSDFGKMVDLSTAEGSKGGNLDLASLSGSRTYARVDINAFRARKPSAIKRLLKETAELISGGSIATIVPPAVFEPSNLENAVKHVQETNGTIPTVFQLRDDDGSLKIGTVPIKAAGEAFEVDSSASYLLAGGLGGIGTVIARLLAENGARRIVCLSRSPGSRPEEQDTIKELESIGSEVVLVKGDMVNREDIFNAVRQAPNLKGIIHAPMLLQDEAFINMTVDQWIKATDPKVKGAWYLHEATLETGIELDFFVFLSSMSGLTGQPGQANYSGANTFLDSFALWRNSLGLSASTINIGPVSEMGYAARDPQMLQRLLKGGYAGVTEQDLIEAFTAAASYGVADLSISTEVAPFAYRNTFATGFSSDKSYRHADARAHWRKDIRTGIWHNISDADDGGESSGGDTFKAFMAAAKSDPEVLGKPETAGYIALEIGKQLMSLLLRSDEDLDITLPVQQLGLDSLVGIELRNWWRQTFGFDISVLQLLGFGTLEELGRQAVKGLTKA